VERGKMDADTKAKGNQKIRLSGGRTSGEQGIRRKRAREEK
jgi:hypothetical protein